LEFYNSSSPNPTYVSPDVPAPTHVGTAALGCPAELRSAVHIHPGGYGSSNTPEPTVMNWL